MEPTNLMDYHSFPIFSEGAPESLLPSHSHKSLKIKDSPKHGSGFRTNSPQDPRFYRIHTRGAIVLVELTNTLADVEDIDVPPGRWQQPNKVGTNWTIGTNYIYIYILVGGIPIPLKNMSESQLGWWNSQLNGKKCSKPPTRIYIYIYIYIYIRLHVCVEWFYLHAHCET